MSKKIKSTTTAQQQSKRTSSQHVCGFDTTPMFFKAIVVKSDHPEVKEFGVRTRTENGDTFEEFFIKDGCTVSTTNNETKTENVPDDTMTFGPICLKRIQDYEKPRKAMNFNKGRMTIAMPARTFKLCEDIGESFYKLSNIFEAVIRLGVRLGKSIWSLLKKICILIAIVWGIPAAFTFVMLLLRVTLPEFAEQIPDIYNAIEQILVPYASWPFNALVASVQNLLSADVSVLTANELALRDILIKILK